MHEALLQVVCGVVGRDAVVVEKMRKLLADNIQAKCKHAHLQYLQSTVFNTRENKASCTLVG